MAMFLPRRRLPVAALLVGVLTVPAAPAGAISAKTLQDKLTAGTNKLGSQSAAYVVDLDAGVELFSHRPDKALSPASNEKLFTTATALTRFGPTATLKTTVQILEDATLTDGRLTGDLYLVGGGDPSLNDVALQALATKLIAATKLKKVSGGVRGDESAFDAKRGSYDSGFGPDDDLGGQLGGLTWGHGRADSGGPAATAAARFQMFLKQKGVIFTRKARSAAGSAGDEATVLATVASPPMSTLIATTNQPSDNFYAETLVKDLGMRFAGGVGTTAAGIKVVKAQMKAFGLTPTLKDGSGLSRADKATPRQLVTLLRQMKANRNFEVFQDSLAVPGRIGTLAGRMRGTAADGTCQAKTGTLRGVSALSGYCTAANGHTIAFSFLENDIDASSAKAVEDKMVPQLVRYTG